MDPSRYADPECTRCEGKGWVVTTSTRTGTGWRDDGHGNPIPVPVPEPTQERDLCGCLDERRALHERAEQERVEDAMFYTVQRERTGMTGGKSHYRYRFVSYYNGARGLWRSSEEDAKADGDRHAALARRALDRETP